MFDHLVPCHPYSKNIYRRHPEHYEPCRVFRAKITIASASLVLSNHYMGDEPFAGLALRQPSVIVTSLEVSHAYLRFFFCSFAEVCGLGRHRCSHSPERPKGHLCGHVGRLFDLLGAISCPACKSQLWACCARSPSDRHVQRSATIPSFCEWPKPGRNV